jgi:DNA-binding response OmpR family regulator
MQDFFNTIDVDGFIPKPCPGERMAARIREILALHDAESKVSRRTRRNVLIAENSRKTATDLSALFSRAGYHAEVAESGPAVVEKAAVLRPNVIVMKQRLPDMSGNAVAEILEGMPNTRSIPIVLYDPTPTTWEETRYRHRGSGGIKKFLETDNVRLLFKAAEDVLS